MRLRKRRLASNSGCQRDTKPQLPDFVAEEKRVVFYTGLVTLYALENLSTLTWLLSTVERKECEDWKPRQ